MYLQFTARGNRTRATSPVSECFIHCTIASWAMATSYFLLGPWQRQQKQTRKSDFQLTGNFEIRQFGSSFTSWTFWHSASGWVP